MSEEDQPNTGEAEEDSTPEDTETVDPDDPIGLGRTLVNHDCDGSYLVILASSARPSTYLSTLQPALTKYETPDQQAQYLETNASCSAFNQADTGAPPIYAAYLGPFEDGASACQTRMDVSDTSTYVKYLDSSAEGTFLCACAYDAADLPDLNSVDDATSTGERRFWMVELQHIMFRAGRNPDQLFGGNFGSRTTAMVQAFQQEHGLDPSGSMDYDSWSTVQSELCS